MPRGICPIPCLLIAGSLLLLGSPCAAADPNVRGDVAGDPAKVLGAESCIKCHKGEMEVWQKHPHNLTFEQLHRKPEAKAIADRMGEKSIKRSKLCVDCHYTLQGDDGQEKAISGVSCESCHGAAQDWLKLHNDYGGPTLTKLTEAPEHRRERIESSLAHGMHNPVNLYLVAQHCYSCHTVPSEELVNRGQHKAGTTDFELVAWSQGKTRHNFLQSNGQKNAVSSPERLRVMFVVGTLTDLEFSLRATAKATAKDTFGFTSAKRVVAMKRRLTQIQEAINDPLVEHVLSAISDVKLKINNEQQLLEAANAVGVAANAFATQVDGKNLAAIDDLLPTPAQYK
jgi:hypothetical protein